MDSQQTTAAFVDENEPFIMDAGQKLGDMRFREKAIVYSLVDAREWQAAYIPNFAIIDAMLNDGRSNSLVTHLADR